MKSILAAAVIGLFAPSVAMAAEARIAPADFVVLNPANGRGYADLVMPAALVASGSDERLEVLGVRLELLVGGEVRLTRRFEVGDLVADTTRLSGARLPIEVQAQLLNGNGAAGVFGRPVDLSRDTALEPSEAMALTGRYVAVDFKPDTLRLVFSLRDEAGRPSEAAATVAVRPYRSPIEYRSPLQGVWLQQAVPTLQSHHRFNPPSEFAVDFFKVDEAGSLYRGDSSVATNAYGFGAPVLAAAEGVVVEVIDDEVQDRAMYQRRPDESPQQAGERIGAAMMARATIDPGRVFAGNLIIIRHERDGVVEYSSYGHLKTDSARVRVGDRVAQGQQLAELGDTGDSPAPHLHFQLNSGPDPFASRSLPVTFVNLKPAGGNSELGRFVTTP